MDILKLTALELGEKIRKKEIAVREAVDAVLARAEAAEPVINSYVTIDREGAYRQAAEIQKKIDSGEPAGPLAGGPAAGEGKTVPPGGRYTRRTQDPPRI